MINEDDDKGHTKKVKERSPNYPSLSLKDALGRLEDLYDKYGKHQIPVTIIHEPWSYERLSGATRQCIAALSYYGLITVTGVGDARKVHIAEDGYRIIKNAPDRSNLIKSAVEKPTIYQIILEKYADQNIPPDDILKDYLIWELKFNDKYVDNFIANFKESLEFANYKNDATVVNDGHEFEDDNKEDKPEMELSHNLNIPQDKNKEYFIFTLSSGTDVSTISIPHNIDKVDFDTLKTAFTNFEKKHIKSEPDDE